MEDILDPACGSKMFYFDKDNPDVLFGDIRSEDTTLCDGRRLNISPDKEIDFRQLPFDDEAFKLVVFDPPHLVKLGENSWMAKKYGKLNHGWRSDISKGFKECFRVLEERGVLIFKWNETQIKAKEVLQLTDKEPLFGHLTGKHYKTIWIVFIK